MAFKVVVSNLRALKENTIKIQQILHTQPAAKNLKCFSHRIPDWPKSSPLLHTFLYVTDRELDSPMTD